MTTYTTIEHITDRTIKVTTRIGDHLEQTWINTPENPLTADDITDEMVERARNAPSFNGRLSPTPRLVREMLTAALTEPPTRPEGAERWEDFLIDSLDYQALTDQQITDLADRIAEEMNR